MSDLRLQAFDRVAQAPGGVARLRELILSLAVRGKLVPQDPGDEPALLLLKTICAEKDRLITQGRLKPDKILSVANDQHPFEIPETWTWVPMGEVVEIVRGITFPASEKTKEPAPGRIACLRTANVQESIEWNDLLFVKRSFMGREDQLLKLNDIVMSMANSRELVGKVALVDHIPQAASTFGGFLGVLRPWKIDPRYAMAFLRSSYARSTLIDSSSQTTNIANISLGKLRPLPFPLPPLAEQVRIVARVDELMRLCDALEAKGRLEAEQHTRLRDTLLGTLTDSTTPEELAANWQRVAEYFDLLLDRPAAVDALEQTVLQLAVRGLLVSQHQDDEPASVLLRRIHEEKESLAAAGKIKRDKASPTLAMDEVPFGLPDSWVWSRLGTVAKKITDGTHHSPANFASGDFKYLSAKNIKSWGIDLTDVTYVPTSVHQEIYARCDPEHGDILYIKDGATTGVLTINTLKEQFSLLSSVGVVKPSCGVTSDYLALLMRSPFFYQAMRDGMTGVAITRVTLSKLGAALVPLPPLTEQARIVARVTELRRLCADLRQRLAASQATQSRLAEALVESVASA